MSPSCSRHVSRRVLMLALVAALATGVVADGQSPTPPQPDLQQLLEAGGPQGLVTSAEARQAWDALLAAGESGDWQETTAKCRAFLAVEGYREPMQIQFAQMLVQLFGAQVSPVVASAEQVLATLDAAVEAKKAEIEKLKGGQNGVRGIIGNLIGGAINNKGGANLIPDQLKAAQDQLAELQRQRGEAARQLEQTSQKVERERRDLRSGVVAMLRALEQSGMVRPLVLMAQAYLANVQNSDTDMAAFAQKHASSVAAERQAALLSETALRDARSLQQAGKIWSAREAAGRALGQVESKLKDAAVLAAVNKEVSRYVRELDVQMAAYAAKRDSIVRTMTRQKYREAAGSLAVFEELKRAFPDSPTLAEDEAVIKEELSQRLEEQVRDRVEKIRTVVADNKDFAEARGMILRLEQDLSSSDPDLVAVVRSLITRIRRELYLAEIAELEKRMEQVLDQLSPYGVAVTNQLRAGNAPTFSTVKLISEGRTNLTKARSELEGIVSHIDELIKESESLERPVRSRVTALSATLKVAKEAVDAGLSRAGSALPLAYAAVAAALLAVGGAVFFMLKRRKAAAS